MPGERLAPVAAVRIWLKMALNSSISRQDPLSSEASVGPAGRYRRAKWAARLLGCDSRGLRQTFRRKISRQPLQFLRKPGVERNSAPFALNSDLPAALSGHSDGIDTR